MHCGALATLAEMSMRQRAKMARKGDAEIDAVAQLEAAVAQLETEAQYELGLKHAKGDGVPLDWVAARRLFGAAAAQGHAGAQASFGFVLEMGHGGKVDVVEA